VAGRNATGDEHALEGARLIGRSLPLVLSDGHDLGARKSLLEGGMHAGIALAMAGVGLAHAMAQAIGGRYGIHHGAANALCLQPALRLTKWWSGLRFPASVRFSASDPAARCEQFARLSGYGRLRDLGVPEDGLRAVAEVTASRPGALANPRPASPQQIRALPLHLVEGDRPVSRRRGVYIIDGSDDADVDGWKNAATCSCLSAAALNSSDERNLK